MRGVTATTREEMKKLDASYVVGVSYPVVRSSVKDLSELHCVSIRGNHDLRSFKVQLPMRFECHKKFSLHNI